MHASKPKIVILGGGVGGMYTAIRLGKYLKRDAEVTLVNRDGYHTFVPMLHEVASGSVDPHHIVRPIRTLMTGRNFAFVEGEVQDVDLEKRTVEVCLSCAKCTHLNACSYSDLGYRSEMIQVKRKAVPYDYLVIALGGAPTFHGIPGAEDHALPFHTIQDAVRIKNHIIDMFELATHFTTSPKEQQSLLTFVVVGSGPKGTELVSDLNDFIHDTLCSDFPEIPRASCRTILVEMKDRVMPEYSPWLSKEAARQMGKKDIQLRLGVGVEGVERDALRLSDGEVIPTRTVIWTAGIRTNPLVEGLPLDKTPGGRIQVDRTLRVLGHPEIFALGDNAYFSVDGGRGLAQNAQVANQEAQAAARNIALILRGKEPEEFRYSHLGDVASVGRSFAVAEMFWGIKLRGLPGWLLWKVVYLKHLLIIQRRWRSLLDWFFDITFDRESSRWKFD